MRSIKTHIGVTISLLALLMAVQFGFFVDRMMKSYEVVMKNEYSIVLVANKKLSVSDLNLSEISKLESIDANSVLTRLNGKISSQSLDKLKANLPKFYNVKISFFPNQSELKNFAEKLKKIEGVKKVEVFAKAHDSIYKILILLKNIITIFTILIVILGILLMIRQIKIWLLEHRERVEIMELFGASFFLKSMDLYRLAILDAIMAFGLCVVFYFSLPNFDFFNNTLNTIGIKISTINLEEIFVLLGVGLGIALLCVSITMLSIKTRK